MKMHHFNNGMVGAWPGGANAPPKILKKNGRGWWDLIKET